MEYKDIIWNFMRDTEWMERCFKGFPPLIVTVATTGGIFGAENNPNLPETPEKQAEETYKAYKAGASIVHVHARDAANGYATVSSKTEDYYKTNKLIREACPDIIINNTTGGGVGMTAEQRVSSVSANPELASLNCGPVVFKATLKKREAPLTGRDKAMDVDYIMTVNFGETEFFAKTMKEHNVKPELEIYNSGQFWLANNLIDKGLIDPPYIFQYVMGMTSGSYPTPMALIDMIRGTPDNAIFEVIGAGPYQPAITTMSIIMGGHVRVGLEDNLYYKRGELATNATLVERVVRIAHELGREVATPAQARKMLRISEQPSQYP